MLLIFLAPNIAAAFGLRFVPQSAKVGRLICYYVRAPLFLKKCPDF
jgi:hypothetical protein